MPTATSARMTARLTNGSLATSLSEITMISADRMKSVRIALLVMSSSFATLPSSWLTHSPEMRHYQGLVWYQRHFTADPKPGERQFLRFGAVNYRAQIYLNGKHVGDHEGGFTTFAVEVTGLVRKGDNQITVGVNSRRTDQDLPPPVTDWETYGGITRDVSLVAVPATYVDDAWVRLTRDGRIAGSAALAARPAARDIRPENAPILPPRFERRNET